MAYGVLAIPIARGAERGGGHRYGSPWSEIRTLLNVGWTVSVARFEHGRFAIDPED